MFLFPSLCIISGPVSLVSPSPLLLFVFLRPDSQAPYLGHASARVFDEIEALERAKGRQQLNNLLLVEIRGQSANVDFVGPIGHVGGDDPRYTQLRHNLYKK